MNNSKFVQIRFPNSKSVYYKRTNNFKIKWRVISNKKTTISQRKGNVANEVNPLIRTLYFKIKKMIYFSNLPIKKITNFIFTI